VLVARASFDDHRRLIKEAFKLSSPRPRSNFCPFAARISVRGLL